MSEWFVVSKTGQVVSSFRMTLPEGQKPDLTTYYEHPELYDVLLTPAASSVATYREFWSRA